MIYCTGKMFVISSSLHFCFGVNGQQQDIQQSRKLNYQGSHLTQPTWQRTVWHQRQLEAKNMKLQLLKSIPIGALHLLKR